MKEMTVIFTPEFVQDKNKDAKINIVFIRFRYIKNVDDDKLNLCRFHYSLTFTQLIQT